MFYELFDLVFFKVNDGTFDKIFGRWTHGAIANHAAGQHKFIPSAAMEGKKSTTRSTTVLRKLSHELRPGHPTGIRRGPLSRLRQAWGQ